MVTARVIINKPLHPSMMPVEVFGHIFLYTEGMKRCFSGPVFKPIDFDPMEELELRVPSTSLSLLGLEDGEHIVKVEWRNWDRLYSADVDLRSDIYGRVYYEFTTELDLP